jgi:hypothetical protein
MEQRLDYKRTFLIGFGFFSTSVMWAIYNMIFLVTPGFFVLAILCMLGVTQGEAKQAPAI